MRRRLIVVFAAVTTMVAIAFIVPLSLFVRDVARERAVDDADRDASALFPVLAVSDDAETIAIALSRTPAGSAGRLTVYLPDGAVAGARVEPDSRVLEAQREGRAWSGSVAGGEAIVAPIVRADGTVAVVRVFVTRDDLRAGVLSAWVTLAAVGAALVIGSVLLADRLARSITGPVTALANASHRLGQGDLTARVEPEGPSEVMEVGAAFNSLAERIGELLHAEREDVADLAHRLRTPLAALRLQVEQVTDADVRAQLGESADDLGRSLDSVITVARRRVREDIPVVADLCAIVAERAAFWGALADEQGRTTTLRLPGGPLRVRVAADELAAVVDVLLENVFSHTDEAVAYDIDLRVATGSGQLTIRDAGTGFVAGDMIARGASTASTGLGLDIARRTVTGAGGTFETGESPGGGAMVRLTFPVVGQLPA
jgi:signal transduction histidine kinase